MAQSLSRCTPRLRAGRALVLAALLGALAAAGCDNPACIYGGNCFSAGGTGGTLGSNPASVPPNYTWLLPGAPSITGILPVAAEIATTSPIVLRFSESMAQSSLSSALELINVGGFGQSVPLIPPTLVGDGRMLVILPAIPLQPEGTYDLRFRADRIVYDLSGTTLPQTADGVIASFTVAAEDPAQPSVVATWPVDGLIDQSTTSEVAVVFDRQVLPSSVNVNSFLVTVDGLAPSAYPAPQAVIFTSGGLPTTDTRAWSWRSVDNSGLAVPLELGGAANLTLSPTANKILSLAGSQVPATQVNFNLLPFDPPLSAEIVSLPMDAIGIANLDGSMPVEIAVQIADGLDTDLLGIFLVGQAKSAGLGLVSFYREVSLGDLAYDPLVGVVTLGPSVLDLTSSTSPLDARFADGQLNVALRLSRGAAFSSVRLLDTDMADAAPQGALLDTTRPTLLGLGPAGTVLSSLRSDLRDLVVVGTASEVVRAAEVTCSLGNNGLLTPTQSFEQPFSTQASGLFVAQPVALGNLAPGSTPLDFTVTIYDRAFNAAALSTTAAFTQVGSSGPAPALPGNPTVTVEVFDAQTLVAIPAAKVFTHASSAGAPVPLDASFTDVNGRVTLLAAPSGQTFVTVDVSSPLVYDLFTFQGVPSTWLSVPLRRLAGSQGVLQGSLVSADTGVPNLTKWASDSRLKASLGNVLTVQSCSFNPILSSFECVFGPGGLVTGPVGAGAFVATVPPANEFAYSAATFLKGWGAQLPRLPSLSGLIDPLAFSFDTPLDAPGVPVEERVIDGPIADLDASGLTGLNLNNLSSGGPRITVESRMGGLGGALLSGYGVAFPTAGSPTNLWRLREAFPGVIDWDDTKYPGDELGQLVQSGIVSGKPFLRAELRDLNGNLSVRRPRFDALPMSGVIEPVAPPVIVSPPVGGGTGGASFQVVANDVLGVAPGEPGIYRATLTAFGGRSWEIWTSDGAGATIGMWAPPIALQGGTPLEDGPLFASVAVLAWPGFDVADFLWSDLTRDYDVLASGASILLNQP